MIRKKRRRWDEPHPVVLLAACESGGADLATLTSFINAFANARAAAVIGTETTLFEGLAIRFTKEMTRALLNHLPLGEAVLQFRRGLIDEYNPLGFVFTAYGDADLSG
jgi:hypothetical protein